MSATAMIHTRIEPKVKHKAAVALKGMGLTVSDAVRMMLTRISNEGSLPFEVSGRAATQEAIDELRVGKGHKVKSIKAMFAEAKK